MLLTILKLIGIIILFKALFPLMLDVFFIIVFAILNLIRFIFNLK